MASREKLKEELLALQNKRGRLRPRDVWRWARRNKTRELNKQFVWDEVKAAELHWDDVARNLIKTYLTVAIVANRKLVTSIGYVRDPRAESHEQAYVSLTNAELDQRDAERIVLAELSRCQSAIERARNVAGVLNERYPGTSQRLESLLIGIVDTAAGFDEAA